MAELLVLDPAGVAENRVEMDITALVGPDGPDFGDAAIEAAMAEQGRYGATPVDFALPNRLVQIPLVIQGIGGVSFSEARRLVQAKAALFQREGGWVKRQTDDGPVYADVVNATLKLGARNAAAWGFVDADAVLTLECLPDWYGDEITLDAITETTAPEIVAVLTQGGTQAVIPGDHPGRCRIVVVNGSGATQNGVLWGFRSRYYSAASGAVLALEAEDVTSGVAEVADVDASGGFVKPADVANGGFDFTLTHVGTYRVWARVKATDPGASIRMLWGPASDRLRANDAWAIPEADVFFLADLGEVLLDRLPFAGDRYWTGRIEGEHDNGSVYVDRIWFQPVGEGGGRVQQSVMAALQDAELRTDGMFVHPDALGDRWARASHVIGDLPRLPPSGLEGRPVELFLKTTRGDFDGQYDSGIDDITAQVFVRPCWLFVPDAV